MEVDARQARTYACVQMRVQMIESCRVYQLQSYRYVMDEHSMQWLHVEHHLI